MEQFNTYFISYKKSILDALTQLNMVSDNGMLTLFVVDDNNCVVGSLTDGDCRRALISGIGLNETVASVMHKDFTYISDSNYSVELIKHIRQKRLKLVPYLNDDKTMRKILDFSGGKSYLPIDAVLMAGGKGERLRPLTLTTPKPLLKVGDKPIIDYNIDNLMHYGVDHIHVTVNYLAEQIEDHFSSEKNGVKINCVREGEKFLGTVGGVQYITDWHNDVILLMNSDLFTNINLEDFYLHFLKHKADMSVAAMPYNVNIPYGILELEDTRNIIGIKEKPSYYYYANAGIYLFKKELIDFIPKNEYYDATDFLLDVIKSKRKVVRFPISGYWIDIGKPTDFQKVQEIAGHLGKLKNFDTW
ncbi:nucleotidyltransferase family protein [Treponema pedis]|uniref:nucleotidyltransferase family protein n=1 Tax=Treponema pedis TaxID=409322 RepID=UPI001C066E64|nr:nucleotidyltransferase family protein [Treponema pedis]